MQGKDYKHAARPPARGSARGGKKRSKSEARPGSWMSFLSGLGIGLVVALAVYLWSGSLPRPAELVDGLVADVPDHYVDPEPARALPRPRFDFYKILPEMEVPVPDWEIPAPGDGDDAGLSPGTYVLQVGSFKSFEDADRAKARLALRGIAASIQRVVINGQDVWFRVHVGPYSDEAEIRAMRLKLIENDMDFILLRIGSSVG